MKLPLYQLILKLTLKHLHVRIHKLLTQNVRGKLSTLKCGLRDISMPPNGKTKHTKNLAQHYIDIGIKPFKVPLHRIPVFLKIDSFMVQLFN